MAIFQRGERAAQTVVESTHELDEDIDQTRRELRDEVDVDPIVEEATARLRAELRHLVARDEWGRELAWRHVARIALGPVLTKLRDQETTIRLLNATRPDPAVEPDRSADDELLDALEVALEQAPAIETPVFDQAIVETPTIETPTIEQAVIEQAVIEQAGPVEPAAPQAAPSADDIHLRWT